MNPPTTPEGRFLASSVGRELFVHLTLTHLSEIIKDEQDKKELALLTLDEIECLITESNDLDQLGRNGPAKLAEDAIVRAKDRLVRGKN